MQFLYFYFCECGFGRYPFLISAIFKCGFVFIVYTSFHPNICSSVFDTDCSMTVIRAIESFLCYVTLINISDIKYSALCVNVVT
jgi:hypothetical protein